MAVLIAAVCLLAGIAAAVAHVAGRTAAYGILKMVAATAYLAFALHLGAATTLYGRLVLSALVFSWLGDLALIGTGRLFLAGLGAFLVGHLAYVAAFVVRGVSAPAALVGAAVMVVVAASTARWLLRAELPAPYRVPVAAYLLAIGAMVALALGTAWPSMARGDAAATGRAILVGAAAFAASDLLVARERFVRPAPGNRLVGLPLYFAGQLLLASSV